VTSYTYDTAGNKLTEVYPDHVPSSTIGQAGYGIVSFTPDATGRTVQRTDQQGDTCDFTYDLAGRLLSKLYTGHASGPLSGQSGTDSFTYDDASRMLTAVSGRYGNTVSYTYDEAGRKATEALTIGGQTYTTATVYDVTGQVSKLTYPDGKEVDRSYSERGQLTGIDFDGTTIDTRTYDDGGRMLTSSYNNGVGETRAYNNDNTLASINFSGAAIGNLSYNWDANKNKTSEGITGTMSGYGFDVGTSGYDDEDRLVSWQRDDNNLDQAWDLSLVGDWNNFTENASIQSRTHGPTHEILTAAGQTVTHDAKGNQTSIPAILRPGSSDPLAMKWDFENKLISADTNNDTVADVTYQWDALGRRVGRDDGTTVSVYVQSGQQTIADYTSGTAAASPTYTYVYASYIDEPVMRSGSGGLRYYHRNQQYSVIALTGGSGSIMERYAYDAYGTPTILDSSLSPLASSNSLNRYTYTGREFDETLGLYHYRARMYDSVAGRFCSRDPIGFDAGDLNVYRYVSSQPLHRIDPSGLTSPWGPVGPAGNAGDTGHSKPRRTHPDKCYDCDGNLVLDDGPRYKKCAETVELVFRAKMRAARLRYDAVVVSIDAGLALANTQCDTMFPGSTLRSEALRVACRGRASTVSTLQSATALAVLVHTNSRYLHEALAQGGVCERLYNCR
jgi:RHS repeat-associated protein